MTVEELQRELESQGGIPFVQATKLETKWRAVVRVDGTAAGALVGTGSGATLEGAVMNAWAALKREADRRRREVLA